MVNSGTVQIYINSICKQKTMNKQQFIAAYIYILHMLELNTFKIVF